MENDKKTELSLEELECVSGGANGTPIVGDYVKVKYSPTLTRFGKVISIGTRGYGNGSSTTVYFVEFLDIRYPKVDAVTIGMIWPS